MTTVTGVLLTITSDSEVVYKEYRLLQILLVEEHRISDLCTLYSELNLVADIMKLCNLHRGKVGQQQKYPQDFSKEITVPGAIIFNTKF